MDTATTPEAYRISLCSSSDNRPCCNIGIIQKCEVTEMSELVRTAQKLEVSLVKTVHLRDYENEEYTCTSTATFNRAMTPEESAVEIAKLQAEIEYAIFSNLYHRKHITLHDYNMRVEALKAHMRELTGDDSYAEYMMKHK